MKRPFAGVDLVPTAAAVAAALVLLAAATILMAVGLLDAAVGVAFIGLPVALYALMSSCWLLGRLVIASVELRRQRRQAEARSGVAERGQP